MNESLIKRKFIPILISLVVVVMICISALGQEQTKDVASLIKNLTDNDSRVRYDAAQALGDIKDTRAVEPLIKALKDNDSDVRSSAAKALGDINDTKAVEPLIEALKDNDSNVRSDAAKALGSIGEPATRQLIQVLKDNDSDVRSGAAQALGSIGEPAAGPLIQALKDNNSNVRSGAALALDYLRNNVDTSPRSYDHFYLSKKWSLETNRTAMGYFQFRGKILNLFYHGNDLLCGNIEDRWADWSCIWYMQVFDLKTRHSYGKIFISSINSTSTDPALIGIIASNKNGIPLSNPRIMSDPNLISLGKNRFWVESMSKDYSNKEFPVYYMPITLEEGEHHLILSIEAKNISEGQWQHLLSSITLNKTE